MDLNEFLRKGSNPGADNNCLFNDKVYSPGWFELRDANDNVLYYALPRLLLQLSLVFILTHSLHLFLRRFGLPRIISKILAGVILGKTVLGNLFGDVQKKLFPEDDVLLYSLSRFGFIFYMFMVGVKMDSRMIWKSGKKAISIGLTASVPPIIIAGFFYDNLTPYFPLYRRVAITSVIKILAIIPFPVIAGLLVDLEIMNTEIGRLSLASALVADIVAISAAISVNVYIVYDESSSKSLGWLSFIYTVVILAVVVVGMRPLFSRIVKWTPQGKPVKQHYIVFICWAVLFTAFLCDNLGLHDSYMAFLLGLAIPDGPPLGSTLAIRLEAFISGLLTPLLISNLSIWIDLTNFSDFEYLQTLCVITLSAVALKFVIVLGPALLNNLPVRDAVTLSIILGAQGIVQGALYDAEFRTQNIDGETFSVAIVWLGILAAAAHLCVQRLYDPSRIYTGYEKRNIRSTPKNSQLRVLVCSQRSDDAMAAIKLLEVSSSAEAPIEAYALNLEELVGQAAPLIINHELGQKNSYRGSLSQQIIGVWKNFEQQYSGSVSVQAFTSVSLSKFMHFDVCSLAFDNLTSLIILPFHRKWNQHGKVIYESKLQRTMNNEVLGTAPCSVGILVDRRKIRNELSRQSKYRVAVIFLGGNCDREALAYAKRMTKSSRVQLNIIRLVPSELPEEKWDSTILDRESLREIKMLSRTENDIIYKEKVTSDGGETALIVNSMADDFDLIIVGRNHYNDSPLLVGLSQWTEFPELGLIGDILASSAITRAVSVLVVQQQVVQL